jgi:acyl-CoA thioesterase-2
LLKLEPIEQNIYRGDNRNIGTGRIFGGQVLAQALVASARTVEEDRPLHSMHGYFILPGDLSVPVVYFVERLRDGGSFSTRRVTGIQNGNAIFSMSSSFHRHEEGDEHQTEMPDVPDPESLRPELEQIRERADEIPEAYRAILTQDRALDFRATDGSDPFDVTVREPTRSYWVKAIGPVDDNPVHHQALLAYSSDYGLLDAALRPHAISLRDPNMMVASLDHSIWFHRSVRMDDWMLYVAESPAAGGARGFTRGTFYTRSGQLVASVAQEGLVRRKTRP